MSFFEESAVSLAAAVRVIKHDASAFDDFDHSVEGFLKSFGAFLFLAPLAYPKFQASYIFNEQYCEAYGLQPTSPDLLVDYLALSASFILWPAVAALMAKIFGLSSNYLRFMTAYNWLSVPAMIIALIPDVLLLTGMADYRIATFPLLIAFAFLLYLSYYVAREGLATTGPIAAAFAFADLVLTYGISSAVGG